MRFCKYTIVADMCLICLALVSHFFFRFFFKYSFFLPPRYLLKVTIIIIIIVSSKSVPNRFYIKKKQQHTHISNLYSGVYRCVTIHFIYFFFLFLLLIPFCAIMLNETRNHHIRFIIFILLFSVC